MGKIITTRLPEEFVVKINYIAEQEGTDVSTAMRKLLAAAIKEWKIENALHNLSLHKISIGQAAEIAEINLWDVMDLAKKKGVNWTGYDEKDLEKDLKILK